MVTKVNGSTGVEFPDTTVQGSAALTAFIGSNQLLSSPGYQKLPGGLIIQWGYSAGGSEVYTVSYPIQFPSQALNVQLTVNRTDPGASVTMAVQNITASSFGVNRLDTSGTNVEPFFWLAIGN